MATILITGNGAPHNFNVGEIVTLEATPGPNFDGNTYQWEFLDKPALSAAVFSDDTAQITSFIIDAEGTYFVRVVVDDIDVGQNAAASPYSTVVGPLRAPAAGETFEVDAQKGWAPAVQLLYRLAVEAYNLAYQNSLTTNWKTPPARVASVANVPLSGPSPLIMDAIQLNDQETVLLKNQASGSENGIFVVNDDTVNYTLTRRVDADSGEKLKGAIIHVIEGATNSDTAFQQLVEPVTIDVTAQVWTIFGQPFGVVTVPTGTAQLIDDGGVRKLRWVDNGNTYEVELSIV